MIKLGGDSSRDKDKKKSARELVKSSEEKYRTLLENLPQKIFLKDRKSVYLACNENYARDLAIDADDIAGKTDDDFFPKKLAEKYKTDDRRVMREGRTEDIEEEYLVEGEKRLVHSVKTPVRDRQGDVIGILGIFWDITGQKKVEKELQSAYHELKETQKQLIQSAKMAAVGELAGGVAHEVKNPLGSIILGINYLETVTDKRKQADMIKIIKRAAIRADEIIRSLLNFSRPAPLELKACDIGKVIQTALGLVESQLAIKNIKLVKDLTAKLPQVMIDENQMEQAFLNILLNSLKAMSEGGKLSIKVSCKEVSGLRDGYGRIRLGDRIIVCEISDTGPGIPEDKLTKVFDPFYTTSPPGEGTGLGLTSTRAIVERHMGVIDIESEEGKGTTVIVILPIVKGATH